MIKEKCNNLEENNLSLNKKFLEKENLSFCKKDDLSENSILINKLKEKDNIIKELKDENNKLKDKCKFYEEKYIQIKSNNANLNEKINHIEDILKTLFNEKYPSLLTQLLYFNQNEMEKLMESTKKYKNKKIKKFIFYKSKNYFIYKLKNDFFAI